ncbi:hypothetical protein GYMLUDRAFT_1024866 [Collybiopsis luxurians FD-317 M1]|uniref:Uncharacterized protein n=1 Tax=Collybiopsis luxurians FD-317 M1 TaxID=944289 RepID=A0A0D0BW12_9AGAR|nr:hypothetical protein GYMLUDRAFT_1024866 [Collybiopsis luxurians FD-317 M1]
MNSSLRTAGSVVPLHFQTLVTHEIPTRPIFSMSIFKGVPPPQPSAAIPMLRFRGLRRRPKGNNKRLPPRPASNLHDYMPPSASRSSWNGMPFSQFERRMHHVMEHDTSPSQLAQNDIQHLQTYLISLIAEMNTYRTMLGLPPWTVPTRNLTLMRHVVKVYWGEDAGVTVRIPQIKMVEDGCGMLVGYAVDYEAMEREWEVQEELMSAPLIEISTKEERAREEAKEEAKLEKEMRRIRSTKWDKYYPYGAETESDRAKREKKQERMRRRKGKPSVFVEMWVSLGHAFRIKRHRGSTRKQRNRLAPRVFGFRRL